MIRTALLAAAALSSTLGQCHTAVRRPAQTIFISMDYTAPFNAKPGDTVNIIMEPDTQDPQGFCDVRGGSLWMNPYTNILICENVDF